MFRVFITVLLLVAVHSVSAETLRLSAKAGEYVAKPIGDSTEISTVSTFLRFVGFDRSASWPPAAYVGFYQGANRDESFQFLIVRNNGNSPHLTVGYRVIEEGKEKVVASLASIPLDASTFVDLSFNKGIVTIKYGDQNPIMVKTRLTKVTPYVSVSSGTAQYEMNPQ